MSGTGDVIGVVCGGVGAARFLRALAEVWPAERTVGVVNTGDDTVLHGLSISPDLDTITYTLAGAIDPERGWGLRDETWRAMESLARFVPVRPDGSAAAPTWFNLGDQDLATHFYRTARLAEGATLTAVTDEVRRAFGLRQHLLPMSDDRVTTMVTLADEGVEVPFQEYFVQRRHGVPVSGVRFDGASSASLSDDARRALQDSRAVVVAPSNPIVSIGPVRALAGVDEVLAARRDTVAAISPIVGGAALKGPADRMLVELGQEASVVGVARLYAPIASVLVIDPVDAHLADQVEAEGMRVVVTPSIMSTPEIGAQLARRTLESVGVSG
ncbi:MAG: 2-phospho-L-lactate transferase [Ilumatobacteraceae bacterium]